MKRLLALLAIIMFASIPVHTIYAQEKEAGATAVLAYREKVSLPAVDARVVKLQKYLESVRSPMSAVAYHFVYEADRLNLDWKLVAAIAGNESYFGKHVPYNSNNAWGWAVWTGRNYGAAFENWEKGITTVSEGLRYKYVDRGAVTIEQIGHIYAADRNWSFKVRHFMEAIENFEVIDSEQLDLVS